MRFYVEEKMLLEKMVAEGGETWRPTCCLSVYSPDKCDSIVNFCNKNLLSKPDCISKMFLFSVTKWFQPNKFKIFLKFQLHWADYFSVCNRIYSLMGVVGRSGMRGGGSPFDSWVDGKKDENLLKYGHSHNFKWFLGIYLLEIKTKNFLKFPSDAKNNNV